MTALLNHPFSRRSLGEGGEHGCPHLVVFGFAGSGIDRLHRVGGLIEILER